MTAEHVLLNLGVGARVLKEAMRSTAGDEFRDLQTLVRQSGLLAKQPAYYGRKMLVNLILLVSAFLLIARFHNPWAELCNAALDRKSVV